MLPNVRDQVKLYNKHQSPPKVMFLTCEQKLHSSLLFLYFSLQFGRVRSRPDFHQGTCIFPGGKCHSEDFEVSSSLQYQLRRDLKILCSLLLIDIAAFNSHLKNNSMLHIYGWSSNQRSYLNKMDFIFYF